MLRVVLSVPTRGRRSASCAARREAARLEARTISPASDRSNARPASRGRGLSTAMGGEPSCDAARDGAVAGAPRRSAGRWPVDSTGVSQYGQTCQSASSGACSSRTPASGGSCRRGRRGSRARFGAAHGTLVLAQAEPLLHRLDLELALAHVLEVFRRTKEHVDDHADERRTSRGSSPSRRATDRDPPPRVLVDPEGDGEPEDEAKKIASFRIRTTSASGRSRGHGRRVRRDVTGSVLPIMYQRRTTMPDDRDEEPQREAKGASRGRSLPHSAAFYSALCRSASRYRSRSREPPPSLVGACDGVLRTGIATTSSEVSVRARAARSSARRAPADGWTGSRRGVSADGRERLEHVVDRLVAPGSRRRSPVARLGGRARAARRPPACGRRRGARRRRAVRAGPGGASTSAVDRAAEERLGRLVRVRRARIVGRARAARATPSRRGRRSRPVRDGELLARDRLARVAEDLGVLERRRSSAARPARRGRSSRRADRRDRPRSPRRRPGARRTRRTRPPSAPRTASRSTSSAASRILATARSNDSASMSSRSCQPLHVRRRVRADVRALRRAAARDRPRRRRLAVRADDVDRAERALRIAERLEKRCMRSRPNSSGQSEATRATPWPSTRMR